MGFDQVRAILDRVKFKDAWLHIGSTAAGELWMQVRYYDKDVDSGRMEHQHGRKWAISKYATVSEVVQTAFKAVMTSAEHQVREHFTYKGARVFGPHFDVEKLVELCHQGGHTDARPAPPQPFSAEEVAAWHADDEPPPLTTHFDGCGDFPAPHGGSR